MITDSSALSDSRVNTNNTFYSSNFSCNLHHFNLPCRKYIVPNLDALSICNFLFCENFHIKIIFWLLALCLFWGRLGRLLLHSLHCAKVDYPRLGRRLVHANAPSIDYFVFLLVNVNLHSFQERLPLRLLRNRVVQFS